MTQEEFEKTIHEEMKKIEDAAIEAIKRIEQTHINSTIKLNDLLKDFNDHVSKSSL